MLFAAQWCEYCPVASARWAIEGGGDRERARERSPHIMPT